MKFLAAATATLCALAFQPAAASPLLRIESAPIFANSDGSGQVLGSFFTAYSEAFPVPARTLSITNTGPVPDGTPGNPVLPFGYDYFIKAQVGDGPVAGTTQMVVNLEGTSIAGQGGMIDIMSNLLAADAAQPLPGGKVYWADFLRIGIYDIPFPAEPNVLTSSRLQRHILADNFDPATEFLPAAWSNVLNGDGTTAGLFTNWDASGLDVYFEVDGGLYPFTALEDSALRLVTFFEGADPSSNGGPGTVPEPGSLPLLAVGVALLLRYRGAIVHRQA